MTLHILLDSVPLSACCMPVKSVEVSEIVHWSRSCLAAGHHLYIPEIIDYELRRELLRAGKTKSLTLLDGLRNVGHITRFVRADLWTNITP